MANNEESELEKVAPPGFSEKTMHELKAKHGVESAFKIAWAAHNKKGKKMKKSEILLTLAKNIIQAEEKLEKADFFNQIKKHPVYGHAFKEAKHYGMSDDEAHEHAFRALQQSNPNITARLREIMAGMNNGKY